jgi:hypothetical protein
LCRPPAARGGDRELVRERDTLVNVARRIHPPIRHVPESVTLKFSVKVSGLSVYLFISQCKYFATH